MVKVVVGSVGGAGQKSRTDKGSVTEKRVRDVTGGTMTLRSLDAGSRTFGADLLYVFGKNVAKARRDNKRAAGAADIAAVKR